MTLDKLKQRQIYRKIKNLRKFAESARGVSSWAKYIRKAYGMTLSQLANRSGISRSVINQIERGEESGQITMRSLKRAADALNCELVYAFVPKKSIEEVIEEQAMEKARKLIRESHLQMELENQAIDKKALKIQLEDLASELKTSRHLWDEE